jgi:hypothetical protein
VGQFGDQHQPDLLASIKAGRRQQPDPVELARYDAITRLGKVDRPHPGHVDPAVSDQLTASTWCAGTELKPLSCPRHAAVLAQLIVRWIEQGQGSRRDALELAPWTGPVTQQTGPLAAGEHPTRCSAIAARIAADQVFAVLTGADDRHDHLMAGATVQSACLAAHAAGFVAQPVVGLLRLPEVRATLLERLDLTGFPQALLRVGPSRVSGTAADTDGRLPASRPRQPADRLWAR